MLSQPIIGNKDEIDLPKIMVSPADWINIEIKKRRYKKTDRKNYIVALLFERLLNVSPDLSVYSFDNVEMAKSIGIPKLACELTLIYKVRRTKKSFASCSLSSLSKNEFRKNR
jgi:hypothetical protein